MYGNLHMGIDYYNLAGYNIFVGMKINKPKCYIRDIKCKITNKNKTKEYETIKKIETLLIEEDTLDSLFKNPLAHVYGIEQKKNNLKELFTAKINPKLRLVFRPTCKLPYVYKDIYELELCEIDDHHYGQG